MAAPTGDDAHEEIQQEMTLAEHLDELRMRLIRALIGLGIGVGATLAFGRYLIGLLSHSYEQVTGRLELDSTLKVLSATEGFLLWLRVCLIGGLLLSSPWVFYQIWQFVAAGLYRRERRVVAVAAPFCALLFIGGALFFLLGISVPVLTFFLGFSKTLGLEPIITLESHIKFMTRLMLVFGLAFQTPVVIFLLVKVGLVGLPTLRRYRRHVILVFFVLSALLTSPSPVDQVALALPMWLLYELGILLAWVFVVRPRRRAGLADTPAEARHADRAEQTGDEGYDEYEEYDPYHPWHDEWDDEDPWAPHVPADRPIRSAAMSEGPPLPDRSNRPVAIRPRSAAMGEGPALPPAGSPVRRVRLRTPAMGEGPHLPA